MKSRIELPGYGCQMDDDGVSHSHDKVKSAAQDLLMIGISEQSIFTIPCISHNETINYRCSCTFQMLCDENGNFEYAMRSAQTPILLNSDFFPIATKRIQEAMKIVLKNLNARDDISDFGQNGSYKFNVFRTHISSISFASSWNDDMDCIVTFNYCQPIYNCDESKDEMLAEAAQFCKESEITSLILRAKKVKEIVGRKPIFIQDFIHFKKSKSEEICEVALGRGDTTNPNTVPIFYHKPEDAFQHPNSNTMLQALKWMLDKLYFIASTERKSNGDFNLLEMYCGCGAHTMAIAKSGIFDSIVAVELDQRLVDACKENSVKNQCCPSLNNENTTPVYTFQGDAAEWAAKSLRRHKSQDNSNSTKSNGSSKLYWYGKKFSTLIVDPPRSGLSKEVCDLAINGSFEHMIYVSCGRMALKGDLETLKLAFDIVDCTITDLFPRTSSVETLVYLRRRNIE